MKKIVITLGLVFIVFALNAQVDKSLTNIAGTLSSVLTVKEKSTITNLTMRGTIDARDFKTMRDSMPVLSVIDISTAKIIEYSGTKGTASNRPVSYKANAIPGNAFFNFSNQGKQTLSIIQLPPNITEIQYNAFRDCRFLLYFPLPESLKSIGTRAFNLCSSYHGDFFSKRLIIPESVISIGESAFEECGIEKLVFSASVTEFPKNAFKKCECLKFVNLQQPLTSIGDSSFFGCGMLEEVYLPNTLQTIGVRAFYNCDMIPNLDISEGLLSIGEEAFYGCQNIWSFYIPASLTSIGKGAFRKTSIGGFYVESGNQYYYALAGVLYNKDLSEIISYPIYYIPVDYHLPSSVKTIAPYAFEGSYSLKVLFIPKSVDSFGEGAFFATKCENIVISDSIPVKVEDYFIFDDISSITLHVPFGSKSLYKDTEPWKNFYIEEGNILNFSFNWIYLSDDLNSIAEVNVYCNNYWTAVSDESWLKVTPSTTLFGDSVITITADQNTGEERKANVIVMSPEKIDTIFVTQEEFSGILFSDTIVDVGGKDNLTASIEVISSGMWIASPGESWLTVTPATPVNGNGTLNIQAQANTGSERTATITVISNGVVSHIAVKQEAGTNSVSDLQYGNKLAVFPNPAKDFIQLNNLKQRGTISIFNAGGMKTKSIKIEQTDLIDISDLEKGIYFICFENKWGKFLKE